MAKSKFTLIGCDIFFQNAGDDLFKNLLLPEGVDKKTLTDNILMEGGEFEVLYANPYYIQNAIGTWSAVHYDTMSRWKKALDIEYAPLENYDRHEDWTDTTDRDSTGHSETDNTNTNENTKSAFDSSSYQPNEKDDFTGASETDVSNTDNIEGTHTGRIHGNIGVTTSQQMLESELNLGYWNLYKRITDLFLRDFVIPVYS